MRMRKLRSFFGSNNRSHSDSSFLGPSGSKFVPNISDPMITTFERLVKRGVSTIESSPIRKWHNLSFEERKAVDSLASDQSIIIREADKGGAIVLLDRDVYIKEVYKQLTNQSFYQEIHEDPSGKIKKLIQIVLVEALNQGYITENIMKMLNKQEYRIPIFYVLPKIHKPGSVPPAILLSPDSTLYSTLSQNTWTTFFSLW